MVKIGYLGSSVAAILDTKRAGQVVSAHAATLKTWAMNLA